MNMVSAAKQGRHDLLTDVSNKDQCSKALLAATKNNHIECVRILAQVSHTNSNNQALKIAVRRGYDELVSILAPHCTSEGCTAANNELSWDQHTTFAALLKHMPNFKHQDMLYQVCLLNQQGFVDALAPYCDLKQAQRELAPFPHSHVLLAPHLAKLEHDEIEQQLGVDHVNRAPKKM